MKSRANGDRIERNPTMAKGVCGRLCHWGPLGAIGKPTKCGIILRKPGNLIATSACRVGVWLVWLRKFKCMLQNDRVRGPLEPHTSSSRALLSFHISYDSITIFLRLSGIIKWITMAASYCNTMWWPLKNSGGTANFCSE